MARIILWFGHDLRLHDNAVVHECVRLLRERPEEVRQYRGCTQGMSKPALRLARND